jgi:hypothetical protein
MYARTINYQYIIDDHEHVKTEKTENKRRMVWEHFYGIKITNLKLAHLFSILVHCVVSCFVYLVFGKNNTSFIAALLFALNPVNNQCSVWLSGRVYATATMFILFGYAFIPLMPVMYALSNWWSISALFTPLMFLKLQPHWMGFILPFMLLLILKKSKNTLAAGKMRYKTATPVMSEISWRKVDIALKTIGYYAYICLFPFKLGMCHEYLHSFGLSKAETEKWYGKDKFFYLGVLVCLLALKFTSLFWFVLYTLQWSNFFVLSHPVSERYIYLSNIGLMYFLAGAIIGTPLVAVFLTFYAVRLYYFLPAYSDIKNYWKSNTENFPKVAMGYNQYGLGLLQYGNNGTALDTWIRGIQERPHDFRLNYNISNILVGSNMIAQAIPFLKTAEANIDYNNGGEFWKGQIEKLKTVVKEKGFEV